MKCRSERVLGVSQAFSNRQQMFVIHSISFLLLYDCFSDHSVNYSVVAPGFWVF